MKKIVFILIVLYISVNGYSQVINEASKRKLTSGFDLYTDIWMNKPAGITTSAVNRGFNFFMLYNIQLGESNITFSPGAGISSHNMYNNAFVVVDTMGVSNLIPFDTLYPGLSYKKNKLTVTYLDIPFEFIYASHNGMRLSLGFKVGFLLQSHTKYKGDDFINNTNTGLKTKDLKLRNIDQYHYGVLARIGWRWINVYGYYSLSNLFVRNYGPQMYPISVGISLIPFYPAVKGGSQ
jgi:hypothetical protein